MVEERDPAIVRSPFGPEVDGRRLLGEAVGFGRALRVARLSIDLGAAVDFARALTLVDIADREQVKAAGAAVFVRRRDDRAVYDAAFDRWWRRRGSRFSDEFQPSTMRAPDDAPLNEEAPGTTTPEPGTERGEMRPDERGAPMPSTSPVRYRKGWNCAWRGNRTQGPVVTDGIGKRGNSSTSGTPASRFCNSVVSMTATVAHTGSHSQAD
jgi:uncharacterized protein with von Willebrand factor type A (vWA) domain